MQLSKTDREQIFHKTCRTVEKQYFDPRFNGKNWPVLVEANRKAILEAEDAGRFESAMHDLVRQLGTSHTGFFHQSVNRVPGRLAVCATFRRTETPDGLHWMFQDVHAGGPADIAGIRPLDTLLAINGQPITPLFEKVPAHTWTVEELYQEFRKHSVEIPRTFVGDVEGIQKDDDDLSEESAGAGACASREQRRDRSLIRSCANWPVKRAHRVWIRYLCSAPS